MKYIVDYTFSHTVEAKNHEEAKEKARDFLYEIAESNSGSEFIVNDVDILTIRKEI